MEQRGTSRNPTGGLGLTGGDKEVRIYLTQKLLARRTAAIIGRGGYKKGNAPSHMRKRPSEPILAVSKLMTKTLLSV